MAHRCSRWWRWPVPWNDVVVLGDRAAAPAIVPEFALSARSTAWLTMAVQAGFVVGTLASALLNLADVINARRLFAVGAPWVRWPTRQFVRALTCDVIMALRFVTGAALACVYPPGMKIAAGWFLERRGIGARRPRRRADARLGVSASPRLRRRPTWTWRALLWTASALAVGGGIARVARGRATVRTSTASAPFDPHAVATGPSDPRRRLATLGYLGHMWELYAMWAWMARMPPARRGGRRAGAAAGAPSWRSSPSAAAPPGCVARRALGRRLGKGASRRGRDAEQRACASRAARSFRRPCSG